MPYVCQTPSAPVKGGRKADDAHQIAILERGGDKGRFLGIFSLRALEAAQETAKAAQALHAANVQERALESSEQKERRRWRWPWDRQDG